MKIAVVGGGIVGATCAYYLSKEQKNEIVVFDYGLGQATDVINLGIRWQDLVQIFI